MTLPAGLSGPSAAVSQLEREPLLALQPFVSWAATRAPENWLSWIMFRTWTLTCPWMITLPWMQLAMANISLYLACCSAGSRWSSMDSVVTGYDTIISGFGHHMSCFGCPSMHQVQDSLLIVCHVQNIHALTAHHDWPHHVSCLPALEIQDWATGDPCHLASQLVFAAQPHIQRTLCLHGKLRAGTLAILPGVQRFGGVSSHNVEASFEIRECGECPPELQQPEM